jgi:hypothetical protein
MKKIIYLNSMSSRKMLATVNRVLSEKSISELFSYLRIGEELHFTDMSGPDLVRSVKLALANAGSHIGIFLDLRLLGTREEIEDIIKKYFAPDMLSISAVCSVDTIIALRRILPKTRLAMVSMLNDISPVECHERFGLLPEEKTFLEYNAIRQIYQRKISGNDNPEPFDVIICSASQVRYLKENALNCRLIVETEKGIDIPGVYQMMKLNCPERALSLKTVL